MLIVAFLALNLVHVLARALPQEPIFLLEGPDCSNPRDALISPSCGTSPVVNEQPAQPPAVGLPAAANPSLGAPANASPGAAANPSPGAPANASPGAAANPSPGAAAKPRKQNIIFMVTDGMGPASLSLARSFRQFRDKLAIDDTLTLDKYLIGSSRTRSNDSLVTDSAAGATAFSCALKAYNGAIGVTPDKVPCGTILEALKLRGYLTGLVVTTRITDATPAAFSAHADYRFQEDLIAEHQLGEYPLGRMVDLILGGGRCHFLPASVAGGCRADSRDLVAEARAKGYLYVGSRQEFDALQLGDNVSLPLLGLLAPADIPYDIDRDERKHPSLAEQTRTALRSLSKASADSDNGFFLLVEGSRIDHAGHQNDPAAQVREVLAFDAAFQEVVDFIDASDVDTLVISTSDHETGGLVTARQVSPSYPDYLWYPEVLLNARHSGEYVTKKIMRQKGLGHRQFVKYVQRVFDQDMGLVNHTRQEAEEVVRLSSSAGHLLEYLNNMISVRSQTGWTTHGHSAVDVNIYAYSNSERIDAALYQRGPYTGLLGNHENIEIGAFMEKLMGVSLQSVTGLLKDTKHSPGLSVRLSFLDEHSLMVPRADDE